MAQLHELCNIGELTNILDFIENTPKNLINFINFFRCLCSHGYLEAAKLLYKKSIENDIFESNAQNHIMSINTPGFVIVDTAYIFPDSYNKYFESIFNIVCEKGYLEFAKWLLIIKPDIYFLNKNQCAFRIACENGRLKIAQWLLEIKPDINISYNFEYIFRYVCKNGHFNIVKYLLDVKPDIKISIYDEYAFRYACRNGYLEIAKFLLEIKPDINISIKNEYAFIFACENNHLNVAQWLSSLYPDKYIILFYSEYKIKYEIDNMAINISKVEKASEISECGICFTENNDLITVCNHKYCTKCIKECFSKKIFACAICRHGLKDTSFTKLIL